MAAHILHKVTFDDGTNAETLEPPRWTGATYQWQPVPVSSVFESIDGTAVKQVNLGATQKWTLVITITGCREPIVKDLLQDRTWQVTLIDRDAIDQELAYELWPIGPPDQAINPKTADRTWTIRFRQP